MRLIRVFFRKSGRGIYISHLDLNKSMQRAVKRSGIPVWYTEGFNPHMYITFALPLSLGYEGVKESMDIRVMGDITNEQVKQMLIGSMPPCIDIVDVCDPVCDPKKITWADYKITVEIENSISKNLIDEFVSQQEILMDKKSKKGLQSINIRPMFEVLYVDETSQTILVRAAAGNFLNLNPSLIIEALSRDKNIKLDSYKISRTCIYNEDLTEFF